MHDNFFMFTPFICWRLFDKLLNGIRYQTETLDVPAVFNGDFLRSLLGARQIGI